MTYPWEYVEIWDKVLGMTPGCVLSQPASRKLVQPLEKLLFPFRWDGTERTPCTHVTGGKRTICDNALIIGRDGRVYVCVCVCVCVAGERKHRHHTVSVSLHTTHPDVVIVLEDLRR